MLRVKNADSSFISSRHYFLCNKANVNKLEKFMKIDEIDEEF